MPGVCPRRGLRKPYHRGPGRTAARERALTHRLGGNVGLVNQKDSGTDGIWTLEYELNVDVNRQLAFYFGVELSRRVYLGNSEDGTFWRAGLNGWF